MTTIVLFGSLFIFLLMSVPIGIAIGLSTVLTMMTVSDVNFSTFILQSFSGLDSYPLMAIPFFMLAGILMGKGGVSKKLLHLAGQLVGWLSGALAYITVVACMFFSAISGSGNATVAAIGSAIIPEMRAKKYGEGFAAAITASAGAIGIVIPPSIPFVLFGVMGGVSIGSLFLAGIIPGILIGIALMIASYFVLKKNKDIVEESDYEAVSWKSFLKAVLDAKWALFAPILILGGIYGGFFTATEAAAVAVVYAFLVGVFAHKELKWQGIKESLLETISITGVTMYMIGVSIAFAYLLTIERVPHTIAETILLISDNPIIILLLINIFLLFVGAVVDTIAALVVLTPILLPIAVQFGIDPVHFGVILVVNLAIGFVTPPIGANLFIAAAVGKVSIEKVSIAAVPLIITLIICLFIISYVPSLSLLLPNLAK
ncbi:TRAP transporter large permease [Oceanobacillus luteolus]|uniref:TRAP transporter large permease n=1 Tax=Oceanobacillus luteolus TaxID=1274358 RepID=A0ABW4HN64_9BACI